MVKRDVHIVCETGSLSGGVRVIGEVANRLHRRGWKVKIWSVNPKETLTSWFKLDEGVDWISLFRTGTIQDYEQLVWVLNKQEGIKMATYWRTAMPVDQSSRSGEAYYLIQDVETSYASAPMMQRTIMDTYELGLHHFTTSRWVESQINADYMGIGVDTGFYRRIGVPRDRLKVIATARQVYLKGWDTLCEVNRHLRAKGIGVTMYGLSEKMRVFVPPEQYFNNLNDEGVLQMYNTAAVYISTSNHEGFNLTALEAMACECPVVKTRDDGSDEYIDDGGNCLVGKDASDLTDKVLTVMGSVELTKTLGQNGLFTAQRYPWDAAIDRLEKILMD